MTKPPLYPILDHNPEEPTVFQPADLLESSRKQKELPICQVPAGCLLDFDGELLENLIDSGRVKLDSSWPCFHTRLYRWSSGGNELGIIGGTVGAPFAVLVAEELFTSGCQALVSIGSAGVISPELKPPFFLLIERAFRDEGTSYHYLPPSPFVEADQSLLNRIHTRIKKTEILIHRATTWTTDAPFRETAARIELFRNQGVIAVEMEAAALLAFAAAGKRKVICLSHVTNQMARGRNDFDKGGATGQQLAISLCEETLNGLLSL